MILIRLVFSLLLLTHAVQSSYVYTDGVKNVSFSDVKTLDFNATSCLNYTESNCLEITTYSNESFLFINYSLFEEENIVTIASSEDYPPGASEELIQFIDFSKTPSFDINMYMDKIKQLTSDYFGTFVIGYINYTWGVVTIRKNVNNWYMNNYSYILEYSIFDPNEIPLNTTSIQSINMYANITLPNPMFYVHEANFSWSVLTPSSWPFNRIEISSGTFYWKFEKPNTGNATSSIHPGIIVGLVILLVLIYGSLFVYYIYMK